MHNRKGKILHKKLPWQHVHFTGVGGVGMCGLAHILLDFGVKISGSDAKHSDMLQTLINRGADVAVGHDKSLVQGADILVYSSAISPENVERQHAAEHGLTSYRRGEFLAELARFFDLVIAVAGSHGKTTTTAMIAHILQKNDRKPGFLIGGSVCNSVRSATAGDGLILVTEVDESDGTQAFIKSTVGVVVNVEDDHCWSLGGIEALEKCFTDFASGADRLMYWNTAKAGNLFAEHKHSYFFSADDQPENLNLSVPGAYNRTNATLACKVAESLGISAVEAADALSDFKGVARRMTEHYKAPDKSAIVIEDYAHHPTELRAAVQALKEAYPDYELNMIFQPHRFERVKRYGLEFAEILEGADRVVVVNPFAAWKQDANLANARDIAAAIKDAPCDFFDGSMQDLARNAAVAASSGTKQLFAVIGAGDVCETIPHLKQELTNQYLERMHVLLLQKTPALAVSRKPTWSELTTLGIGSAEMLMADVRNGKELEEALQFAQQQSLPVYVLGGGSNLVGSDEPVAALVLRLQGVFFKWRKVNTAISAGAGIKLGQLCRELATQDCLSANYAPFAWIPATLGGAVCMNAGAQKVDMSQWVEKICGVRTNGELWEAETAELNWSYRKLALPQDVIVTRVLLKAESCSSSKALTAIEQAGNFRRQTQPNGRSAGCVFRNPEGKSAGALLDHCGCKGLRVGGCQVSLEHANFIIADPGSSARDFTELCMLMQRNVFQATGIILKPEVQWINDTDSRLIQHQSDCLSWR